MLVFLLLIIITVILSLKQKRPPVPPPLPAEKSVPETALSKVPSQESASRKKACKALIKFSEKPLTLTSRFMFVFQWPLGSKEQYLREIFDFIILCIFKKRRGVPWEKWLLDRFKLIQIFLESDEEYRWPSFKFSDRRKRPAEQANAELEKFKASGDFAYWPFIDMKQYVKALSDQASSEILKPEKVDNQKKNFLQTESVNRLYGGIYPTDFPDNHPLRFALAFAMQAMDGEPRLDCLQPIAKALLKDGDIDRVAKIQYCMDTHDQWNLIKEQISIKPYIENCIQNAVTQFGRFAGWWEYKDGDVCTLLMAAGIEYSSVGAWELAEKYLSKIGVPFMANCSWLGAAKEALKQYNYEHALKYLLKTNGGDRYLDLYIDVISCLISKPSDESNQQILAKFSEAKATSIIAAVHSCLAKKYVEDQKYGFASKHWSESFDIVIHHPIDWEGYQIIINLLHTSKILGKTNEEPLLVRMLTDACYQGGASYDSRGGCGIGGFYGKAYGAFLLAEREDLAIQIANAYKAKSYDKQYIEDTLLFEWLSSALVKNTETLQSVEELFNKLIQIKYRVRLLPKIIFLYQNAGLDEKADVCCAELFKIIPDCHVSYQLDARREITPYLLEKNEIKKSLELLDIIPSDVFRADYLYQKIQLVSWYLKHKYDADVDRLIQEIYAVLPMIQPSENQLWVLTHLCETLSVQQDWSRCFSCLQYFSDKYPDLIVSSKFYLLLSSLCIHMYEQPQNWDDHSRSVFSHYLPVRKKLEAFGYPFENLEDVGRVVSLLAERISATDSLLPTYYKTNDGAHPHIELDVRGFHYVCIERGHENSRKTTWNPNELLKWIFSDITFSMAVSYELKHRTGEHSVPEVIKEHRLYLLSLLDPSWR